PRRRPCERVRERHGHAWLLHQAVEADERPDEAFLGVVVHDDEQAGAEAVAGRFNLVYGPPVRHACEAAGAPVDDAGVVEEWVSPECEVEVLCGGGQVAPVVVLPDGDVDACVVACHLSHLALCSTATLRRGAPLLPVTRPARASVAAPPSVLRCVLVTLGAVGAATPLRHEVGAAASVLPDSHGLKMLRVAAGAVATEV